MPPTLVGVKNVPRLVTPRQASLEALRGPSLHPPWVGLGDPWPLAFEGWQLSSHEEFFHRSSPRRGP